MAAPGDLIRCPHCGGEHALELGANGNPVALFYLCRGRAHIGAMQGALQVPPASAPAQPAHAVAHALPNSTATGFVPASAPAGVAPRVAQPGDILCEMLGCAELATHRVHWPGEMHAVAMCPIHTAERQSLGSRYGVRVVPMPAAPPARPPDPKP